MTVMVLVLALMGLGMQYFADEITSMLFPTVGEEAIMVGVSHRQVIGMTPIVFCIYFLFMRNAEETIAKRFLFASGLCFSVIVLGIIRSSVIVGVTAFPIPPVAILVIFSIASFYVSKKIYLDQNNNSTKLDDPPYRDV